MEVIEELEDMFLVSVFSIFRSRAYSLHLNRPHFGISFTSTMLAPGGSFSIEMGCLRENMKLLRKLRSRLFQV
jgi:hypothetical protein